MITEHHRESSRSSSATVAPGSGEPQHLRRPVALLLSRFPLITETFILREIIELENLGQPVRLVPLIKEKPQVTHREARPWVDRALYTPYLSGPILRSNLKTLWRRPAVYWSLFRKVILGRNQRFGVRVRALALFPKAVYLAERLHAEGIRHIHAHFATYPASVAFVIASLADISYSLTVHAHDIFVGQELLEDKLSAAQWIRTISLFNKRFILDLYPEILSDKVKVIHVGVNPLAESTQEASSGVKSDSPLLLSIAALKPYKGLSVLLAACRLLRNMGVSFRCQIIGGGPLRESLQLTIERSGLSEVVRLVGSQPQHEVARAISESSLIVLPSIVAPDGQMEGIPVALMEAMAAGRPVVASALSGIPELIDSGVEGILTTPGDEHELASAIGSLLADPATGDAMGERGRKRVTEHFNLTATAKDLLGHLDNSNPSLEVESELPWRKLSESIATDAAVGVRCIHRRRDSTVAELLFEAGREPHEVILKTHRSFVGESRPARLRATEEFNWLRSIHRSLGQAQSHGSEGKTCFHVPRPLELLEDSASLTMERCRGESLLRHLRRYRGAWLKGHSVEITTAVRQAGEWLRIFQSLGAETENSADPEQYLQRATRTALDGLESHLSPSKVSRYRRHFDRLQSQLEPNRLDLVARHGDFWPGNVFVDTGHVEVIDFEGLNAGLAYEDVADFVAHLELLFAYPFVRPRGRELVRAFVDGFLDGTELDPVLYRLCKSVALLRLIRTQPAPGSGGVLGAWRRHHLQTMVPIS